MNGNSVNLESGTIPKLDIRKKISEIDDLPSIPEMAIRILDLRDNPDANINQLVEVIQLDPAMAAQVIRYANSPLYGNHNNVDNLHDAIFRVLGFETVLYIALGSALAQAFRLPSSGPFGLTTFWHNSVFSAAVVQKLAFKHGKTLGIKPGNAYLCALLHNIGYLVLAMLFESEYFWLNKVLRARPESPVTEIETELLGASHTELGAILAREWNLPEEVITAIAEHHNLDYDGEHANLVRLIQVTDQLLRSHKMSDADSDEISLNLCEAMGLDDSEVYLALDDILESSDILDTMVKAFSGG